MEISKNKVSFLMIVVFLISASFGISLGSVNAQISSASPSIPNVNAFIGDPIVFQTLNNLRSNDSNVQFIWNFGDGISIATRDNSTTHIYTETGNFTVTLLIQDKTSEKTVQAYIITVSEHDQANFLLIGPLIASTGAGVYLIYSTRAKLMKKLSKDSGPVVLGASAPQALVQGNKFSARFVAYSKSNEKTVKDLLANLSPRSTLHLGIKKANWQKGITVKVSLIGDYLKVEKSEQEFAWNGEYNIIDFDVEVLLDAPKGITILKFDVGIDDFIVATLRLDLSINEKSTSKELTTVNAESARTAFASYASEDKLRVLDRIDAVRISAGLDVFTDCLSLHPSENWKKRIEHEINQRELFLLFWSKNAQHSKYVTWEWKTALLNKEKTSMQIHPLQPIFDAPPPKELNDIHFGSVGMLARKAFEDSEKIKTN